MSFAREYGSLLAKASSSDLGRLAQLEELKKAKDLQEAKDRIKERQERERERQMQIQRLDERKRLEGDVSLKNSTSESFSSTKKQPESIEESPIHKKTPHCSKSMSFKELLSHTSNMNPEILRINPTFKVNAKTDSKSSFNSKDQTYSKSTLSFNNNIFLKPKTDVKSIQVHNKLVSPMKTSLMTKNRHLLQKPIMSVSSSSSKSSINKPKKGHFFLSVQSKNSTKSKIITEFHPDDLTALRTGPKRDLRTIEEIQNDIWRRKGKKYPFLYKNTPENNSSTNNISYKNGISKDISSQKQSVIKHEISHKKIKPDIQNKSAGLDHDISSEIWKIFGKRKEDYILKDYESDSDMEATGAELLKEEEFSSRIGRIEDKEEERKEMERKMNKRKR